MLGTALAILAMTEGVRLKIGGMPAFFGWILGGFLVWLIIVGLTILAAELLRRHRRAISRYTARQTSRAARHGWRTARRHSGRGLTAASKWADGRWAARQAAPQAPARQPVSLAAALHPSRWLRGRHPAAGTGPQPALPALGTPAASAYWRGAAPEKLPANADDATAADAGEEPSAPPADADGQWGSAAPARDYGTGPWILHVRRKDGRPYYDGPSGSQTGTAAVWTPEDLRRRLAAAATDPGIEVRVTPLKVTDPGLVPAATDPADGAAPSADTTDNHQHGGTEMTTGTADQPVNYWPSYYSSPAAAGQPAARARRTARTAAAPDPGPMWKTLITATAEFEPEDDHHLLTWMAGEAGGMSLYAEGVADAYETAVNTVGLNPVAMQALHDYADAAASAAEAMAAARQRFADHYAEVRQFAANGGVLPYNGRWMTGEGD